ncbi:MAG: D-alanyl-D-alanine carboxypeptidase [Lentisphaerae bacterium]|nr:D-alanyl-D-alanine carboxypeptidase [Lentisphaerota bacterium]
MNLGKHTPICLLLSLALSGAFAARAPIAPIINDPYTSYIVVDGISGAVILEENADRRIYPASVIKLMDLLLVIERIEDGRLTLDEWVHVTPKAARMGGSQVYLKEGEMFSLDEMLYALSIKSANDVAMALALHVGGTEEGFIKLMNERAAELGMTGTEFHSVHGLPPDAGDKPDVSTARDLATLSLEIAKHPRALTYTSTIEKWFRNDTFQLLTHNRLLRDVEGCDGLKTGYFRAAGFSISASATRSGRRVIAVVAGCKERQARDDKARELLTQGFATLPELKQAAPKPKPEPQDASSPAVKVAADAPADEPVVPTEEGRGLGPLGKGVLISVGVLVLVGLIRTAINAVRRKRDNWTL